MRKATNILLHRRATGVPTVRKGVLKQPRSKLGVCVDHCYVLAPLGYGPRTRYIQSMSKSVNPSASSNLTVRNSRTGQFVTVKGAGALKGSGFAIRKGIDLTKPVAKQATKGKAASKQPAAG